MPPTGQRRAVLLLVLGAGAGIALAASGLGVGSGPAAGLPDGVVARVNGQPILTTDYEHALAGLTADRRARTLAPDDRRRVLDRLIDETLLVQRGVELGLVWRDDRVRKDVVAAMVDVAVADGTAAPPTDEQLRAFFDANRDFFARTGRLRVRQVWCRAATPDEAERAETCARDAAARLRAGEDFAAVRAALGDAETAPIPDALLPPAKLLEYLGPTALRAALALPDGAVTDPVRSGSGYHVVQVVGHAGMPNPEFEQIRDQVQAELQRRANEDALRRYLADLRSRADIEQP